MLKYCPDCSIHKHIEDFGLDKTRLDGHTYNCKECRNKANKKWYDKHGKKKCQKCKKVLSRKSYYKSVITKDGLFGLCKNCCKTHKPRKYQYLFDLYFYGRYWKIHG